MATEQDAISPKENEEEIRAELQRVLASTLFTGNENSSKFLELIVSKALKGEPIKQSIIALELFPQAYSNGKLDRVRLTAMQLRKILAEYYDQEGRYDRIAIRLPPPLGPNRRFPTGKSYTPVFMYNSRSPAVIAYEKGLSQYQPTNSDYLENYVKAICHLEDAIIADPNYAPAYAARAEVEIWEAMYRQSDPPHNPIEHAEQLAKQALRLHPGFWQAQMVLGAVNSCRYQWKQAQMCFDAAIEAARDKVFDHPWYPAFLLVTGRQKEALRIANARVAEKPGSLPALIALAFFVCVSHDHKPVKQIMNNLRRDFPDNWLTEVMKVFICVSTGSPSPLCVKDAFGWIRKNIFSSETHRFMFIPKGAKEIPYVFPGLHYLGLIRSKFLGFAERAREMDVSDEPVDLRRADYWPKYKEFQKTPHFAQGLTLHYSDEYRFWTPFQCALAYMAKKDVQNAIHSLQRAMDEGDPLTVFLHLLPFFDPLRSDPGFQKLVKRMRLPEQMKSP